MRTETQNLSYMLHCNVRYIHGTALHKLTCNPCCEVQEDTGSVVVEGGGGLIWRRSGVAPPTEGRRAGGAQGAGRGEGARGAHHFHYHHGRPLPLSSLGVVPIIILGDAQVSVSDRGLESVLGYT